MAYGAHDTHTGSGPNGAAGAPPSGDRDRTDAVHPLREPLAVYLNDHLLGATAGGELARRVAKQHARSPAGGTLVRVADEIAEDRGALLRVMLRLGVPPRRYRMAAGWLLEKAGRVKSNGFLLRRAPLSSVLELEALRLGVEGKRLMWQALRGLDGPRSSLLDDAELARLLNRAHEQAEALEDLQRTAAAGVLDA
ncbi:hypothetical protein K378_01801 [Streptomyces sp. Amel2xB2]|uniref:hypothetical protein n=1 Tax=Streptomyces sp. Amel2xB2 TaxID=1305829 RepID=UPI000DC03CCF|nr:hypothetical protein [Streptomyces sp. Amel2xB2]RAJ68912.1 hypothetical protein K378_01801 [Streptomyces sp. Amel2xB2]